jgi:hypothetical protein
MVSLLVARLAMQKFSSSPYIRRNSSSLMQVGGHDRQEHLPLDRELVFARAYASGYDLVEKLEKQPTRCYRLEVPLRIHLGEHQ